MTAGSISGEYSDPRWVALYDLLNPYAADTEFYIGLAAELEARTVIDIGCGTGLLASELARRGHTVVGVEPSPAMLGVARGRAGADLVRWIDGDASVLGLEEADLVIMTGHVAQVISDDGDWRRTLVAAHRSLRSGGRLAFESLNPTPRPWLTWTSGSSRREVRDLEHGKIEAWTSLRDVRGKRVSFVNHIRLASGEELTSPGLLSFRSAGALRGSLRAAGFQVEAAFGDWSRRPLTPFSPEMIFIARRGAVAGRERGSGS